MPPTARPLANLQALWRGAVLALACGLALAACGGSPSQSIPNATSFTSATYRFALNYDRLTFHAQSQQLGNEFAVTLRGPNGSAVVISAVQMLPQVASATLAHWNVGALGTGVVNPWSKYADASQANGWTTLNGVHGIKTELHQGGTTVLSYVLIGGADQYFIRASAPAGSWASESQALQAIIASFRVTQAGSGTGATPSPPQAVTTTSLLHAGQHLTLRCGLALTIPARYHGSVITSDDAQSVNYDSVASTAGAMKGLEWGFGARSLSPAGVAWARSTFAAWPVAASSYRTVVVRSHTASTTDPQGKRVAMTTIVATVRLPHHPTGVVILLTFGKHGSRQSPAEVLAALRAAWRLFHVKGATLPSKVA